MRTFLTGFFLVIVQIVFGQRIDSVNLPSGVIYKYGDPEMVVKAKRLVQKELSDSVEYEMNNGIVFIGPVLWSRYRDVPELKNIPGVNLTLLFNGKKLAGKVTQDRDDFKKVWDYLRLEAKGKDLRIRKAAFGELQYYWSVISFDIEEPLLIAEAGEHRYILNLSPKDLKLIWLDEVPLTVK